jgi:hypothetical protein
MSKRITLSVLLAVAMAVPCAAQEAYSFHSFGKSKNKKTAALGKLWRDAESDDERSKIKKMVMAHLNDRFDNDLDRREEELQKVERRVQRLREQLEKRAENKEEIVELQLKQMTMSWDGLGWSDHPAEPSPDVAFAPPAMIAEFGRGTATSESIRELIESASESGDEEHLRYLAEKLAGEAKELDANSANTVLWHLYESTHEQIDDEEFWMPLAKVAEKAADEMETAAILDTAARLYHLAGELDRALELQTKAVEIGSGGNWTSEGKDELNVFLKELKEEKGMR